MEFDLAMPGFEMSQSQPEQNHDDSGIALGLDDSLDAKFDGGIPLHFSQNSVDAR